MANNIDSEIEAIRAVLSAPVRPLPQVTFRSAT